LGFIVQDLERRAPIFGFETAGIQGPTLQQVPGQELLLVLLQDVGCSPIGSAHIATQLPGAQVPAMIGGVLPNLMELGSLDDQLHDLGGALLCERAFALGHGRCSV
jgi:hypothetical protein